MEIDGVTYSKRPEGIVDDRWPVSDGVEQDGSGSGLDNSYGTFRFSVLLVKADGAETQFLMKSIACNFESTCGVDTIISPVCLDVDVVSGCKRFKFCFRFDEFGCVLCLVW